MAHGQSNSGLFTGMPEEAERPMIANVLDTIAQHTGKRARGWLGPALTETDNTLDLLAAAGIDYVADWCNDEQPYFIKTKSKPIVAMPSIIAAGGGAAATRQCTSWSMPLRHSAGAFTSIECTMGAPQ